MKQFKLEDSKIIIVHYVNQSGMTKNAIRDSMINYHAFFGKKIENAIEYIIPVSDRETTIEFYSIDNLDKFTIEKLEKLQLDVNNYKNENK